MKIKLKILLPAVVLTILTATAILVSNIVRFSDYVDQAVNERIETASTVAQEELDLRKVEAASVSTQFAENPKIVQAFASGDRTALLEAVKPLVDKARIDFCTFLDVNGAVVLRVHEPNNFGDSLASQQNVQLALAGKCVSVMEQGTAVRLSIRAGAPIYDEDGTLIGVVSTGFRLDTDSFVDNIKRLLDCEATIFLGDERISTTIVKSDGTRAIGTKADDTIARTVLAGKIYMGRADILGEDALTRYVPLADNDGKNIGMVFIGKYLQEESETVMSFILMGILLTAGLMAIFVPTLLFIAGRVVAPIKLMVDAAGKMAAGDLDIDLEVRTKDEMRDLSSVFNEMIKNTREQVQVIERISRGDLTVDVRARSDKDVMNRALREMVGLNNDTFSKIVASADNVSTAAHQMADSSQLLASGASQQAATVDELSTGIEDVNDKTRENVEMAQKAAALGRTIMENAEKGSERMDRMVSAVREINDANKQINNIIQVIDDIAFQTNILALNAAVEAAHAGQHGKGFAVVAEEVRVLAAKSAEAAKNTGSLIENSMGKAEIGVRIAGETADSLGEIVSGIHESGKIVDEIARSSTRQSDAISNISVGIHQITQVVQQNSSAAQESAATSEEMSNQAELLRGMVGRFQLKGGAEEARPLEAFSRAEQDYAPKNSPAGMGKY